MPTVAELLASDKTGVVWLLDVTFNDFASVAYRWSTATCTVDGNDYDGRIASITPVQRSFGRDHLPAASTTKLRISNSDFLADWMIDRTTVATQLLQARFRLSVYLFDSRAYATAADALSGTSQPIGVFNCLDQPEQMDSAIDVTLADDSLGRLAEPLTTPTIRDWQQAPLSLLASPDTNPFNSGGPRPGMDWDVPLPLVFGMGEFNVNVPAYKGVIGYESHPGPIKTPSDVYALGESVPVKYPIVVCVAKSGNNNFQPLDTEITRLQATYSKNIGGGGFQDWSGKTITIPRKFRAHIVRSAANGGHFDVDIELWRPRRSPVITKNGRTWQVVWIEFNIDWYVAWFVYVWGNRSNPTTPNGYVPELSPPWSYLYDLPGADVEPHVNRHNIWSAFESFRCNGSPLSTVTTMLDPDGRTIASKRLVDMIHDAIAYYSKASTADMDTTAWQRASRARATVAGAGIIQPSRPRPLLDQSRNGWVPTPNPRDGIVGVLRTALGEMCQSADVDLFMTKAGLYSITANALDFTAATATPTDVTESRTSRVRIRTPSQGERWAPYNRVMMTGPGGVPLGPYDNQEAIDEWGTILPRTINAKWNLILIGRSAPFAAQDVWDYRTLESKVRPAVRFLADREYLQLELGEHFTFTYTRGNQAAVFDGTLFRLEGMRINPMTLAVELDGIWVDDLASIRPYLLDDETLVEVVAVTSGRPATVLDAEPTIEFTGGDLVADGVEEGDILELRDSSQAANVFSRYRRLRIATVSLAGDAVTVDDDDLDFDAAAPTNVEEWTILRGATSYPTAVSDPTNYPSGSTMYGKACDENDEFSDSSEANQLLEG